MKSVLNICSEYKRSIVLALFICAGHISFSQCNNIGFVNSLNVIFGACDPANDQFTITGDFEFITDSPGGVLTVTATNGSGTYTQTYPGPYVAATPYAINIPNIPSDGTPIVVTAFFSNSVPCGLSLTGTSPLGCVCTADAGTFDQSVTGNTNTTTPYTYDLCFGDLLNITANGNYQAPQDFTASWTTPPIPLYDPGIFLMVYSCPPSTNPPANMLFDPCFVGVASTSNGFWNIINTTGSNQTLYYVPTTMYSMTDNYYAVSINGGDWCFDQGPTYAVTYLSPIVDVVTENCTAGTSNAVITGGKPANDGSIFSVVPGSLTPATAAFVNTTCNNGGSIAVSGLVNGDVYSYDVVDSRNCPVTISGTFVGPNLSGFSYPQPAYCANNADPTPTLNANSTAGGTYTATPAGLTINAATGLIDLSASTAGTYTVSYATTGSYCPTTSTFTITVNPQPNITLANQSACTNATAVFTPNVITAGTYDYTWTVPAGVTNPGNVSTMTTGTAGNYTVFVTNQATNCVSNTSVATMTIFPVPSVTLADESFCAGLNATLTAVPGQAGTTNYNWTVPAGVPVPGNVASFTSNVVGAYTVQIIGANGCLSQIATANVTSDPGPNVSINDSTFCAGGNAILTVASANAGTFSYVWTVPAGAVDPGNVNNITTTTAGAYDVLVTDLVSGCASPIITGVVTINPLPTVMVNNSTICLGDNSTITATPGVVGTYTYSWTVPAGAPIPGNVSNFLTTIAGTYDVQITNDLTGCQSLPSSGTVTVNPLPTVSVNDASACDGFTNQITATPGIAGGYDYSWTVPAGATNPGNIATFNTGVDGVYSVVITDLLTNCFSAISSGNMTVFPNPVIDAGLDQIGCELDNYILSGSGAGIGGTYAWTNGIIDGVAFNQPVGNQTYTVTGTSNEGCIGTDMVDILVDVTPVVSFSYLQDGPCVPATVIFTNTSMPGGTNCVWTFDDGSVVSGCGPITKVFNVAGIYGVNLTLESVLAGCVANDYQANIVTVEDNPIAGFMYAPDELTTLYNEVTFTNSSSGATNYSWNFGDNSAGSTLTNPIHVYDNEAPDNYLITLIATTAAGCVDSAQVLIEITDELLFYVPNAFTPDNNEFNDVFKPVFTSGFEAQEFNMLIFNRWGEVIFESNDADLGWDGTYGASGSICQNGVYIWKITYRIAENNDRNIMTGHVNLLR